MASLDEWCFDFHVTAPEPIPRRLADDLLWGQAVGWAEARGLGIGGGYRPASPEVADAARAWRFRFGLCVQSPGPGIPESQAAELRDRLRSWCAVRGLAFRGGFRAFTATESGPTASEGDVSGEAP